MKEKITNMIQILIRELERLVSMNIDTSSRRGQLAEIERADNMASVSREIVRLRYLETNLYRENNQAISDINTDIELNK